MLNMNDPKLKKALKSYRLQNILLKVISIAFILVGAWLAFFLKREAFDIGGGLFLLFVGAVGFYAAHYAEKIFAETLNHGIRKSYYVRLGKHHGDGVTYYAELFDHKEDVRPLWHMAFSGFVDSERNADMFADKVVTSVILHHKTEKPFIVITTKGDYLFSVGRRV